MTSGTFFQNLPMYKQVRGARLDVKGERKYCYLGLKLKGRENWGKNEDNKIGITLDTVDSLDSAQDVQHVQGLSHSSLGGNGSENL